MTPQQQPKKRSSAEKRILWEVSQRYNVNKQAKQKVPKHAPAPPRKHSPRKPTIKQPTNEPKRKRWALRIGLLIFAVIILSGGIFGYKILAAGNNISATDKTFLGQLKDLLFSSEEILEGEGENRINILLIAIGGEGHKGRNLADTIMVASIRPQDNSVALLSIPRDLYVQVPEEDYYTKINAVHAYGESQKKGDGPKLLQKKIEEITGLPIHYYARIDFTAFKHIVDAVGGLNITIENSFEDYWHKISFPAGTEKMNGERSLAYVRARYIRGPEGGDFKRAARQQQVLLSLKEKVFSIQTALDFRAISSILSSLSENIITNMQLWEMKRFYELARIIDQSEVRSIVLTTGHNGVLIGSTEVLGGVPASILKPRTGDYTEIQKLAANIFSEEVSTTVTPQKEAEIPEPEPTKEAEVEGTQKEISKPSVEIRNGTSINGLAKKVSDALTGKGYEVTSVGNAKDKATIKTTAYAISTKQNDKAKQVANDINAASDSGLPSGEKETSANVLVILGTDAE